MSAHEDPDAVTYKYLGTDGKTLFDGTATARRRVTVHTAAPSPVLAGELWLDKTGA